MARRFGEKLKILYLRDYLLRYSDERHPVTVSQMIDYLKEQDIQAERKSIYRDLQVLGLPGPERTETEKNEGGEARKTYGMDIRKKKDHYFVAGRDFTLQEVKLLVDMVQSSNFITRRKTEELIRKITALTSVYEEKNLSRTVYVRRRIKAMNESVYQIVDKISEAVNADKILRFQYFTYNMHKEKELRHGGKIHVVSPFALIWVDQNYYMLGYNHSYSEIRPFRVDRMTRVSSMHGPRKGKEEFEKIDMATFTTKVFHMFTGEIRLVTMRFRSFLADSVIDRFGEEVILVPENEWWFQATAEVAVSPQFYGWLAGFGKDAELVGPASVREGMAEHVRAMMALYQE